MTTRHILPGLRPEPLASYLAGLGLFRVIGEQADENATAAWNQDTLEITTTVEDIPGWLAEEYRPTPVLSPWNNGSGFGPKDKEPLRRISELREHPSPRLAAFRDAISLAESVRADMGDADKSKLVLEFRNRCPDELLPWIDASVVLAGDDTFFPPLLGTGGNDGRLDFSTNFHQRLLEVIGTPRSALMAGDLLIGTEVEQLAKAPIGQFDPAGAGGPGSSKFGAAESLVNPWGYVLFVEGALLFASSASRRNQFAAGRAAMPFTVSTSPDGSASGAANEESRGEVWAPVWSSDLSLPEVKQLFAEARASWRGRPARRAAEFYGATRTLGVARGVERFTRFGLQRRNGLAFAAVPLAPVYVRERPEVALAAKLEDWANRFGSGDVSTMVGEGARRFQKAYLEFARDGGPRRLVAMLATLTSLEQAVGRSGRARENSPVRFAPPADEFLPELAKLEAAELRVAVGLASCATLGDGGPQRALRHLLLPIEPNGKWRDTPVISGFGARVLPAVLADVLIWRSRTAPAERNSSVFRGVTTFRAGIRVPADDLHAFAADRLDPETLDTYLRACLALNWRGVRHQWQPSVPSIPVPTLGVLQPLADGLGDDERVLALGPDWAVRLAAGQVAQVHQGAVATLRQAGWTAVPAPPGHASGVLIGAALVPRCLNTRSVLSTIATKIKEQS
jgi:CRISPR-associated protein Csx17